MLDINKIIWNPLPPNQFDTEVVEDKRQIVLHHTASGDGANGDILTWRSDKTRVATAFVLERDGDIHQCFNSKQWAYHLGLNHPRWPQHDRLSIGIEIDSWGWLVKRGEKFYSWTGVEVPKENVHVYDKPWRGLKYFERYTPQQISKLEELLVYLCDKFKIPKGFGMDIFEINQKAINLERGIFSHASFLRDKTDAHPQPELLEIGRRISL